MSFYYIKKHGKDTKRYENSGRRGKQLSRLFVNLHRKPISEKLSMVNGYSMISGKKTLTIDNEQ
ncbi:hypothetical protein TFKS16_1033 [Tannerella forsythia KS16]|uniref:Uncharacterized protein n=1 Tax=Tannerella forsythia (strain ATCC 43037 / JCM 10827 / CCUG 21028 A / KCTC 5666 / FDC 338) TaxID=203275 RepID=G8UIE5_TANFA|nr:hypothetical protein BFO_1131 [Tannerella forsythia 92A2]BAR48603.1 hypothetical protein TF3313_1058 [Tannerella forsythia 3313]BAR51312.1 hypothetical protein TFKS16_1033 [Tannerella forsythia KS16]